MDQDMIRRLRESNELDLTAARLLDCAAVYVDKGWTQTADARDATGEKVEPHADDAVCWCAQGALKAASFKLGVTTLNELGLLVYPAPLLSLRAEARAREGLRGAILAAYGSPGSIDTSSVSITTWNDAEAKGGDGVARTMRTGAGIIRERIECVQKGIKEVENA